MKKLMTVLLIVAILMTQIFALAEGTPEPTQTVDIEPTDLITAAPTDAASAEVEYPKELVIGTTTAMSGYFYSDLWGTNTSDMDVRGVLHGYSTIAWLMSGNYAVDETICTMEAQQFTTNGNKVYTFSLRNDLTWNNGENITAKDYVFTLLLQNAPEVIDLGARNETNTYLLGYDDFSKDSKVPFAGVRLIDDYSFSLTVLSEYLPYFYELALVNVAPTPLSVIAPGIDIADDGNGAYFTSIDEENPVEFTSELIAETLLGEDGYVYKPLVTCGAFSYESFDKETSSLVLVKNPYYIGNFEGKTPEMEKVTFKLVSNDTMLDELSNGTVDVLNKVSKGAAISAAFDMVNDGTARLVNYLRSGFGFIAFACEQEPTSDVNVRKALMMCLDSLTLCSETMDGYALPVYGYYGLGQWMASEDTELLEQFNVYGYDPVAASELLADSGWTYNEQGGAFTVGVDTVRCKIVDNQLIPLELNWAKVLGSTGVDVIEQQLTQAAEVVGFRLNINEMSFTDMLSQYYRQTERTNNLFFLASNFNHIFDPYYTFNTADEYQGELNRSGLIDDKLMELADDMRRVEPGEVVTYKEKWLAFQQRFVETLPMAPLYSNVYFDVYRPDLYGYAVNNFWSWGAAILYASFDPAVEATPEPAMETPSPDDETITIP